MRPSRSIGGKGEPVAMSALLSVHSLTCAGSASASEIGLLKLIECQPRSAGSSDARHNDWTVDVLVHLPDDPLVERASLCGRADL